MAAEAGVDDVVRGGPTLAEVVRRSAAYLERHGMESPTANAETLLMSLLGTDRAGLYARREGLDERTARLYGRALCRRCAGTPLQHLTGEQQFLDLRLRVVPGVFVPRPETEILAATAIELIDAVDDPVVVDVGTGTGAVALTVKARRPQARVVATDLSPAAVELCRDNADRLGLAVEVVEGDLLGPVPPEVRGRVDLVVSNPPYLTLEEYENLPEEVRADPFEALVGGVDVHARLAADAPAWLRDGGHLAVEIGAMQANEVSRLLSEAGFGEIRVRPDLAGRDRVVSGRLVRPSA
jgi:release factor glutamine methyltransferase